MVLKEDNLNDKPQELVVLSLNTSSHANLTSSEVLPSSENPRAQDINESFKHVELFGVILDESCSEELQRRVLQALEDVGVFICSGFIKDKIASQPFFYFPCSFLQHRECEDIFCPAARARLAYIDNS